MSLTPPNLRCYFLAGFSIFSFLASFTGTCLTGHNPRFALATSQFTAYYRLGPKLSRYPIRTPTISPSHSVPILATKTGEFWGQNWERCKKIPLQTRSNLGLPPLIPEWTLHSDDYLTFVNTAIGPHPNLPQQKNCVHASFLVTTFFISVHQSPVSCYRRLLPPLNAQAADC